MSHVPSFHLCHLCPHTVATARSSIRPEELLKPAIVNSSVVVVSTFRNSDGQNTRKIDEHMVIYGDSAMDENQYPIFKQESWGKRIQTVQLGIWWIGLRENLQNTMALPNNNQVFLQISPWSAVPKSTWTVCLGTLGTTQIPKTTWISNRCFWFWRPRHRTIERSSQPSWNCLEKLHEAPGCLDGWYYQATSHSAHHQTRSTAA